VTSRRINRTPPAQFLRDECDWRSCAELTRLKVCVRYESIRECAIGGDATAAAQLEKEYPGWDRRPFKRIPERLVKERIKALQEEELLAAASQICLQPDEIPANELYAKAVEEGRPLVALPVDITPEALAKVEGLDRKKYKQFLAQRGPLAREAGHFELDWSLPDETLVSCFRAMLKLYRPIPPINQEQGSSSTLAGLRLVYKALVVYRLLGRQGLSITQAVHALEAAGIPAPYSMNREQRWGDAHQLATWLLSACSKGELTIALQRFLMTRQGRKLFGRQD
jgi:hypothetical protein